MRENRFLSPCAGGAVRTASWRIAARRPGQVDLAAGQLAVIPERRANQGGRALEGPESAGPGLSRSSATVIEELRAYRIKQAQELLRLGLRATDEPPTAPARMARPLQPDNFHPRLGPQSFEDHPSPGFGSTTCATPMLRICSPAASTPRWLRTARAPEIGTTLDLDSQVLPGVRPTRSLALTPHCARHKQAPPEDVG